MIDAAQLLIKNVVSKSHQSFQSHQCFPYANGRVCASEADVPLWVESQSVTVTNVALSTSKVLHGALKRHTECFFCLLSLETLQCAAVIMSMESKT